MNISVLLHNIRSAHNVGSIFRTADAIGVSKIYLCGYTPAPIDRFGREVGEIAKTALGAEKSVVWEKCSDILKVIEKLKHDGFEIIALEQDRRAVDYKAYEPKGYSAIILGNEVGGIEKEILAECDNVLEIPMFGEKESLNVSVAAGILLYRLFDK